MPPYATGVIHGRFQVPHNDHMRYLLAGWELCDHLVVGVTNPDPVLTRQEDADPRRGAPENNPLTFYERQAMLRAALHEAGVPERALTVVPLPIGEPDLYRYYVPLDAVFFMTIYDDWGRAKQARFEQLGLAVHVLWERTAAEKGISGSEVRAAMRTGDPWRHLVPPSVARLAEQWRIPGRLGTVNT